MSKLQGKSKLSSLSNKSTNANQDASKKHLTTSNTKANITTGLSPKTFRFTREEMALLDKLTRSIQNETNKNMTQSKIVRGLVWYAVNKPKLWKDIIKSINENI